MWTRDQNQRAGMFLMASMTVLCAAAVAFYIRFLFALHRERKPVPLGCWVRLRLGCEDGALAEARGRESAMVRAA